MVATFRGVDWGGQAGPFKRVNVRSHPSAPARWEWGGGGGGDRCRHLVKKSGRTVQLTAVRETSRNDGRRRCWDGGLQTPENSSFGYFTDFIFILQILFCSFYFTDFILLYRFHYLFYRFYFFIFTDFILQILFYRLKKKSFYFTDFNFILQILFWFILFCSFYFTDFILCFTLQILFSILQILFYRFIFNFSFYFKDYNWHWAVLQWIFSNNNNKIRKKS